MNWEYLFEQCCKALIALAVKIFAMYLGAILMFGIAAVAVSTPGLGSILLSGLSALGLPTYPYDVACIGALVGAIAGFWTAKATWNEDQ